MIINETEKSVIFIADEDQTVLSQIFLLLKDTYDLKLFKSGKELFNFILESNCIPDLILLDVLMQDTEGYDIIRELKSMERFTEIPIICLSAKYECENEVKGFETGAVDYITKPFHPIVLKARIKTHLSNKYFKDMLKFKNAQLKEYSFLLKKYLEIIELAPISILITDRNNRIIFVNKHYLDNSGYSKNEVLSKDPGFIKSGETPIDVYDTMWENLKHKKMWEGVLINKKKNGEIFHEETKILPITNADGKIEYYVAVKLDITEKLKLQEKEKMLSKAKALINLSAGIAHHLNNINAPLLIISEYLANKFKNEPEYKKMLQIMIDSVERATNLINSIRTFSKNNIMLQKIVNFNNLIKMTVLKIKPTLPNKINFYAYINTTEDIKVFVNIDMIDRAVMNIVENSIEAMSDGGSLSIKTYKTDKNGTEYAVIEIKDDGIGMSDDIKSEIFEPFFTTKSYRNAKGLGLSETLGIIEQHGGLIELESEVNKGTVVSLFLPIYKY